jgi:hypothetical protein
LAEELPKILERNMSGENAWHVQMNEQKSCFSKIAKRLAPGSQRAMDLSA